MPRTLFGITIFAGFESILALTFAEVDITDFITALGFLLTAVLSGIAAVMAQRRRREVAEVKNLMVETTKVTTEKIAEVKAIAEVTEGHVNSAASKSDAIIAAQETQLNMLRATIANQEKQAALLAQARASSEALAAVAIAATNAGTVARPESDSGVATNIKETAENTKAIEQNTAKTEADVKLLKENL